MAVSNAQKIAKAKYQQSSRTLIAADVSKSKGEFYRQSAKELDLSLSMLIQNGVEEYIRNHAGENILDKPQGKSLSPADEKLLAEFSKLPVDARKHLLELAKIINQKGGGQND